MVIITNINEKFGMSIDFMADTVEMAVNMMLHTIRECGSDFASVTELKKGIDYEVKEEL